MCERAFAHGLPCEKKVRDSGETPNGLNVSETLRESHLLVYYTLVCQASSYTSAFMDSTILSMKLTANANRQFHFDGCRQLSSARTMIFTMRCSTATPPSNSPRTHVSYLSGVLWHIEEATGKRSSPMWSLVWPVALWLDLPHEREKMH